MIDEILLSIASKGAFKESIASLEVSGSPSTKKVKKSS